MHINDILEDILSEANEFQVINTRTREPARDKPFDTRDEAAKFIDAPKDEGGLGSSIDSDEYSIMAITPEKEKEEKEKEEQLC